MSKPTPQGPCVIELIARLSRYVRSDNIRTVYFSKTLGTVPESSRVYVLWLGCGDETDNGLQGYFLCEILNPDSDKKFTANLYDLGVQHVAEHSTLAVLSPTKATVYRLNDANKTLPADGSLGPCGWNPGTPPVQKGYPEDPYIISFVGPSCVLKIVPSIFITTPGNGTGSPPPPYTGGEQRLPR